MLRPVVLATAIACVSTTAHAERYGGEILGTDAIGWTIAASGFKFRVKPVTISGLGIVLVGAPAVHLLHDNPGRAGVSLAMRGTLPILGRLAGGVLGPCHSNDCIPVGPTIGTVVGYLGALVIDVVVVAKQDDPVMPAARMVSLGGRF